MYVILWVVGRRVLPYGSNVLYCLAALPISIPIVQESQLYSAIGSTVWIRR